MLNLIVALLAFTGTWETFSDADLVLDIGEKGDTLFLSTSGGLLAYLPESDSVVARYTNIDGLETIILPSVCVDDRGGVWVAMKDWGIAFRRPGSHEFEVYPTLQLPSSIHTHDLLCVGDTLLLGTEGGLVVLDTKGTYETGDDTRRTLSVLYPKLGSNLVLSLDRAGDTLYVGTGKVNDTYRGGVTKIPWGEFLSDSAWTYWSTDSLPGDSVLSVKKGSWTLAAGTNGGLFLFEPVDTTFEGRRIRSIEFENDTFYVGHDRSVWKVYEGGKTDLSPPEKDARSIHLAGDGEIFVGFGAGRPETEFEVGKGLGHLVDTSWTMRDFGQLTNNRITSVVTTNDGTVWFGNYSEGRRESYLFALGDSGWFSVDSSAIMWPWWMEASPDGEALWVGTWPFTGDSTTLRAKGGLFKLNTRGEIELHYSWPDVLPTPLVACFAFDEQGNPIVGCGYLTSLFGWFRINPDSSVDEIYKLDEAQVPNQVAVDRLGRIWTGGEIEGIKVREPDGDFVFSLKTSDGLPSDVIWRLVSDGETMWIGTSSGLASYEGGRLTTYGLPALAGEIKDIDPGPDGRLWVLTDSSVVVFRPDDERVDEAFHPQVGGLVSDFGIPAWFNPYVAFRVKNSLALYPERGEVWVGTSHGLSLLRTDFLERFSSGRGARVYPNPYRKGEAEVITFANLEEGSTVRIYTLSGELVPEGSISTTYRTNSAFIDPDALAPGTYIALIESGNSKEAIKFAIMK